MYRYERRCRRLLTLAYPPRFLADRGEEVLGLLLDLGGPGADRLPPRLVVDVLSGGVRYRFRNRPPLLRWLGYRVLDMRLPAAWRPWVRDDIMGRLWPLRRQLGIVVLFPLVFAMVDLVSSVAGYAGDLTPSGGAFWLLFVPPWVAGGFLFRKLHRQTQLRRHGLADEAQRVAPPTGQPPPPWPVSEFQSERRPPPAAG